MSVHAQNVAVNADLKSACEIVPDKLYFVSLNSSTMARRTSTAHFFSIDAILLYEPFFGDFGPLNLGCLYRFCETLNAKMEAARNKTKVIYFYCGPRLQFRANGACLIGCYSTLFLGKTPAESYTPLRAYEPYMPFRDAATGPVTWRLTVPMCIRAVHRARGLNFFNFDDFNCDEYEYFECVENGDLTEIIKGKFMAFAGPHSTRRSPDGYPSFTPEDYVPVFKKFGVHSVVRLNQKLYEKSRFTRHGFFHHDQYFIDGTTPTRPIVDEFIRTCETEGYIAVHCKAGLGRTGTLMGMYMMWKWHMPYDEAIAWLRICRPGSVIGPQQHYLRDNQDIMWKAGAAHRKGKSPVPLSSGDCRPRVTPTKRPNRTGGSNAKTKQKTKSRAKKTSPYAKKPSPTSPYARGSTRSTGTSTRSTGSRSTTTRSRTNRPTPSSPMRR